MAEEVPSKSISVALVIDQLTFDRLGPVIHHLSVGLIEFVSQVTLITPAQAAHDLSLGPVRVIQHKRLRWPFWRRGFQRIVQELNLSVPTVIHAFTKRSFHLGKELSAVVDRPLIRHLLSTEDLAGGLLRPTGRPEKFIAASEPLLAAAQKRRAIDPDLLTLVRPGLLPVAEPSCFVDENLTPTILCMSALEAATGVDRLIRAVKILVDEGQKLMLFLLAKGPHEIRLRKLIEAENLIKCVTLVLPIAEWGLAMQSADIFVVPGAVERVDVRLLHAMASGTAAVTCAMPNSDFMIHEQTGLICSEEKPQALADAIRRLLHDRALARRLARSALDHCKRHHSLSIMAEKTAAVYRQLDEEFRAKNED